MIIIFHKNTLFETEKNKLSRSIDLSVFQIPPNNRNNRILQSNPAAAVLIYWVCLKTLNLFMIISFLGIWQS